jgi:hypothetical protein
LLRRKDFVLLANDIISPCIDERMPSCLPTFLSKVGISGRYHVVPAFGCSLGLDHEFGLIGKIVENLGTKRITIVDHLRCKAFGRKFPGLSLSEEREKHYEFLQLRSWQLQKLHPSCEVRLFLLTQVTEEDINGEVYEQFEVQDESLPLKAPVHSY